MRKPIIVVTLAYTAGLVLGRGFLYFPFATVVCVLLGLLAAGILFRFDALNLWRCLLVILSGLAGMVLYLYSAAWFPPDHYTRVTRLDTENHELIGTIVSPLDRDQDKTGFVLDVRGIDGKATVGKIRVTTGSELTSLGYGDTIRFIGKLFSPRGFDNPGGFDYAAYLARSAIYRIARVKNPETMVITHHGTGIFRTIQDWRERIRQSFLASTSGPGSAILQAMTLGEEGGLTDELRDRFMAAGVTHIISISGSHLAMVALLCFGLVRWIMFLLPERQYHRLTLSADPGKITAWITLPLMLFYTLLAGGQMATVRSLIMISAGLLALVLDREKSLTQFLALAALCILITSPQAIFDISFQLSYLSVLVIAFVVALWKELGFTARTAFQRIRNSALLLVIISLATSLATGPIVAHYFNQFSLAGIIANMVVVPFAGFVVVPLGLCSGILSLFTLRLPLAGLNQFVADVFISIVSWFARIPFAEFHPPAPNALWLILYGLFLFSFAAYARERLLVRFDPLAHSSGVSRKHVVGMALPAALAMLALVLSFIPRQGMLISFPDVGQGDSALIEFQSGKTVLIDGGGVRDNTFDVGRRVLAPYLWDRGIRGLDLVVLSHPHPDHLNGLLYILKKFAVAEVWDSGIDTDLPGYDEFRRIIEEKKIARRSVSTLDQPFMLGGATLTILHPRPGFYAQDRMAYAAENNRSLVVRISSENRVLLFTGDIGIAAEQDLLRTVKDLKADLVKVPHHGSKSSSCDAFVAATRPEAAIMTVGKGNRYRHPADLVVSRYEHIGSRIYRTDKDGAITIKMSRDHVEVAGWSELMFRRITLATSGEWAGIERQNWRRFWKRMLL